MRPFFLSNKKKSYKPSPIVHNPQLFILLVPPEKVQQLFLNTETLDSKELDKEEFRQVIANSIAGSPELPSGATDLLDTLFAAFDDDGSGTINQREPMDGL